MMFERYRSLYQIHSNYFFPDSTAEEEPESHSFETILASLHNVKIRNETSSFLMLKICSDFFQNNDLSKSNLSEDYYEFIISLFSHKSTKKLIFGLKLLHLIIATDKDALQAFKSDQILPFLFDILSQTNREDISNPIFDIFSSLIRLDKEQFTSLFKQEIDIIQLIDYHIDSLSFLHFLMNMIPCIVSHDNTLLFLEYITTELTHSSNPENILILLDIAFQITTTNPHMAHEYFNRIQLWPFFLQNLREANSPIKLHIIKLLSCFVSNDLLITNDFYDIILDDILVNTSDIDLICGILELVDCILQKENVDLITQKEVPEKILRSFLTSPFVIQERVIAIISDIVRLIPALFSKIEWNIDFIEVLCNHINESVLNCHSLIYQNGCTIIENIIDIEKKSGNDKKIIEVCMESINFDELMQRDQNTAEYMLTLFN